LYIDDTIFLNTFSVFVITETEGGRVELPRALTPQRFSRAVPSPIGLTFQIIELQSPIYELFGFFLLLDRQVHWEKKNFCVALPCLVVS
jgi:hypothetical protein